MSILCLSSSFALSALCGLTFFPSKTDSPWSKKGDASEMLLSCVHWNHKSFPDWLWSVQASVASTRCPVKSLQRAFQRVTVCEKQCFFEHQSMQSYSSKPLWSKWSQETVDTLCDALECTFWTAVKGHWWHSGLCLLNALNLLQWYICPYKRKVCYYLNNKPWVKYNSISYHLHTYSNDTCIVRCVKGGQVDYGGAGWQLCEVVLRKKNTYSWMWWSLRRLWWISGKWRPHPFWSASVGVMWRLLIHASVSCWMINRNGPSNTKTINT